MIYRDPEYCHRCGKPLKAIHINRGSSFVGDTFSHYAECQCQNIEQKSGKYAMEKKAREIIAKFTPEFIYKYRHNALFNTVYHTLVRGGNPYDLIEQLIDMNTKLMDEAIERIMREGT